MASNVIENGLAALKFARDATLGFLEDIPRDKVCHQLTAGGNHALWITAHIALTDDDMLSGVGGRKRRCPADWTKLFGMGSKPVGDLGAYPSYDEIKQALHERREELAAWFKSLSDAQASAPLPKDFEFFAPNQAALASSIAWHEGLHAGQLTMIRRDLGIAPKFA